MRDDILELFWTTYEEKAWKRLTDILDSPITTEDVNTFAVEAIASVNKNEIIKKWGFSDSWISFTFLGYKDIWKREPLLLHDIKNAATR